MYYIIVDIFVHPILAHYTFILFNNAHTIIYKLFHHIKYITYIYITSARKQELYNLFFYNCVLPMIEKCPSALIHFSHFLSVSLSFFLSLSLSPSLSHSLSHSLLSIYLSDAFLPVRRLIMGVGKPSTLAW